MIRTKCPYCGHLWIIPPDTNNLAKCKICGNTSTIKNPFDLQTEQTTIFSRSNDDREDSTEKLNMNANKTTMEKNKDNRIEIYNADTNPEIWDKLSNLGYSDDAQFSESIDEAIKYANSVLKNNPMAKIAIIKEPSKRNFALWIKN
jgi:hypothetical protein